MISIKHNENNLNEHHGKKYLITSALPYVNNVPHLGNIIGCVLSADVYARFCRLVKRETLFICGTDEHGTATEAKAMEENLTPKEICDKYYKIHSDVYNWFNISFDKFGRTSDKTHHKITQGLFMDLYHNGFIVEDTLEQAYCEKCDKFLADRFVKGICPYCNFDDAKGDQCDKCGHVLNPDELKSPKCALCNSGIILKKTDHLFLDLEQLQEKLEKWSKKQSKDAGWSQNAIRTTNGWFKEGLTKRCITRDLKWGIPVPKDVYGGKYKNKVFYVWFDAPIGYMSITKQLSDEKFAWWKDKNVLLNQFMAKDNIPFHTIIFPGVIIGANDRKADGDTDILLHNINATEYLNYEDGKFSKSRGTGVFGNNAKDTGIPTDVWRYYLLINRPEKADSVFGWDDFQKKLNNELVANLGNFSFRTTSFISRFLEGKITSVNTKLLTEIDHVFIEEFNNSINKALFLLNKIEMKDALREIMHLSQLGNIYFQNNEPWKMFKENKEKAINVLMMCANALKNIALIISPYLPETSDNIFKQLGMKEKATTSNIDLFHKELSEMSGKLGENTLLFNKLEDEDLKKLKLKFSGKQVKEDTVEEKGKTKDKRPQFRVAEITNVENHPDAEKLYKLSISFGEEKRTLVAGLRAYLKPEELLNKKIIVAYNLEPAKLRGIKSEGMLIAAAKDDIVKPIKPSDDCPLGSIVQAPGLNTSEKPDTINFNDFKATKLDIKNKKLIVGDDIATVKVGKLGVDMPDGSEVR